MKLNQSIKLIVLVLTFVVFDNQLNATPVWLCEDSFLKSTAGLNELKQEMLLNSDLATWMAAAGQVKTPGQIAADQRFEKLKFYLRAGDVDSAVREYMPLFFNFENSFYRLQLTHRRLKEGNNSQREEFELSIEKSFRTRIIAELIEEYLEVRSFLESLKARASGLTSAEVVDATAASDQTYSATTSMKAKLVDERLGFARNKEGRALRPPLAEVQNFFDTDRELEILVLERKISTQKLAAVKAFFYPLLNSIRAVLYRFPETLRKPMTSAFNIGYADFLRVTYLPMVARIIKAEKSSRVDLLLELDATIPRNELLYVFARVAYAQPIFREILAEAKRANDQKDPAQTDYSNLRAALYLKMVAAERQAFKDGVLPVFEPGSKAMQGMQKLAVAAAVLISGAAYFYPVSTTPGASVADKTSWITEMLEALYPETAIDYTKRLLSKMQSLLNLQPASPAASAPGAAASAPATAASAASAPSSAASFASAPAKGASSASPASAPASAPPSPPPTSKSPRLPASAPDWVEFR